MIGSEYGCIASINNLKLCLRENNRFNSFDENNTKNILYNIGAVYSLKDFINPDETNNEQIKLGTGLFLTNDGWFVTSYHSVKDLIPELDKVCLEELVNIQGKDMENWLNSQRFRFNVKDSWDRKFTIDPTVQLYNPFTNLSILKTFNSGSPGAVNYSISDENYSQDSLVKLINFETEEFLSHKFDNETDIIYVNNFRDRKPKLESLKPTIVRKNYSTNGEIRYGDNKLRFFNKDNSSGYVINPNTNEKINYVSDSFVVELKEKPHNPQGVLVDCYGRLLGLSLGYSMDSDTKIICAKLNNIRKLTNGI